LRNKMGEERRSGSVCNKKSTRKRREGSYYFVLKKIKIAIN
jgi:hypothetical protein